MSKAVAPPEGSRRGLWFRRLGIGGGVLAVVCAGAVLGPMRCWSAWLQWGIDVDSCPAGTPLGSLNVDVYGMGRAQEGSLYVHGIATYTYGPSDVAFTTPLPLKSATARLLTADGDEQALEFHEDGWETGGGTAVVRARLPADLPDGDHKLVVEGRSRLGEHSLTVDLPVYAPAKVHLLTDRPLYEAGHTVSMRSVALRARDLVPLPGRPGRFTVHDPHGRKLLDERVPASDWGVAASSFPIDTDAEHGTWTACWVSHTARGCSDFEVTEFTLPRFTVSATGASSWSGRGDRPLIDGTVRLASGAPVADAEITVDWRVDGAWTMPHAWSAGELPTHARSDAAGRFRLELPVVPEDLVGQATLVGNISAVDPSGDRQTTQVRHLLSVDDIAVSAVTEIGEDSLVEGKNNRLWLRATTASGTALPGATLEVTRAWDPTAPALTAVSDEDGVAALQIDPGAPVNVVVPEPPHRPPPPPAPVRLTSMQDLGRATSASLADQRGFEAAMPRMEACADYVTGGMEQPLLVAVVENGRVFEAHGTSDTAHCLADRLQGHPMPVGQARVLQVRVHLQPPPRPSLTASSSALMGGTPDFGKRLPDAIARARHCMPELSRGANLPLKLQWTTQEGSLRPTTRWMRTGAELEALDERCFRDAFRALALDEPADTDATGLLSFSATPAPAKATGAAIPQERVVLGYELAVQATTPDGESLGTTRIVLPPGRIPDLRLRAEPTLPEPGGTVTLTFFRGPDFSGKLPEELYLEHASGARLKGKVDEDTRQVSYTLPDNPAKVTASGWWSASWGGALARVYVAPPGHLEVTLASSEGTYRPGEDARIQITTTGEDGPVPAAVSLVGVDRTLQELAPLPGPGALEDLQAQVQTAHPAFGTFDGVALVRQRISGENARAATILRVGSPPSPEAIDAPVSTSKQALPEPRTVLVDHFFPLLAELLRQERAWEKAAAKGDKLDPAQTARLWSKALDAVAAREGEAAVLDAYGRPLRLHHLPSDLLDMTAPHNIAADGTRLPQDLENWGQWVAREEPK